MQALVRLKKRQLSLEDRLDGLYTRAKTLDFFLQLLQHPTTLPPLEVKEGEALLQQYLQLTEKVRKLEAGSPTIEDMWGMERTKTPGIYGGKRKWLEKQMSTDDILIDGADAELMAYGNSQV